MAANLSHRALSSSPSINYESGLKEPLAGPEHGGGCCRSPVCRVPSNTARAAPGPFPPLPTPIFTQNSIRIHSSSPDRAGRGDTEILTVPKSFPLEIQPCPHRQRWRWTQREFLKLESRMVEGSDSINTTKAIFTLRSRSSQDWAFKHNLASPADI